MKWAGGDFWRWHIIVYCGLRVLLRISVFSKLTGVTVAPGRSCQVGWLTAYPPPGGIHHHLVANEQNSHVESASRVQKGGKNKSVLWWLNKVLLNVTGCGVRMRLLSSQFCGPFLNRAKIVSSIAMINRDGSAEEIDSVVHQSRQ